MKAVSMMLKTSYAQESKETAMEKVAQVAEKLKEMKLSVTAKKLPEALRKPSPTWTFLHNNGAASEPIKQLSA